MAVSLTSVMRYRSDEDSGEVLPPKPHRLKPLADELTERNQSADDTANVETSAPFSPKPPDRPLSGGASPKTRMMRGSHQTTPCPVDSLDATSGASTADTVTPLDSSTSALEESPIPFTLPEVSLSPEAGDSISPLTVMNRNTLESPELPVQRAHSTAGTSWTKMGSKSSDKLQFRRSLMDVRPPSSSSSVREVVDFFYRKAEQKFLWTQMHARASLRVDQGHKAHKEDEEHRAAVLEHVPDTNLLGLLDDSEGKSNAAESDTAKDDRCRDESNSQVESAKAEEVGVGSAGARAKGSESLADERRASPKTGSINSVTCGDAHTLIKGKSPLKELITAKKVDLDQVRVMITRLPDAQLWIDTIMDPGPPLVPKPIVHAVAMNDPGLVDLLVELGAEVVKPYDGPSMYKGCVKPGQTLLQCVSNRKGRFVGTMLADRLAKIEETLARASVEQMAKAGENEKQKNDLLRVEGSTGVEVVEVVDYQVDGQRKRRKSVAVKTQDGQIMRHTQGHPSDVFEISEHLGDGERSHCYMGFHKETKVPVAIKVESKSDEVWLWEEVNILRKVEHPNVVKLFETFENDSQVFMVLELCEGGRLLDKVEAVRQISPDPTSPLLRFARLLKQTAVAVEHLHSRCICHRDIQPSNFLNIDEKPLGEVVVKLIDFTTAKRFGAEEPPMKTKICTPGFVAKEILTRKEVSYTEKIDVWSLGVLFFTIISGVLPFSGPSDFEILKKVKKGSFKFEPEELWRNVGDSATDLISRMICAKVEDRLSARGVVEHPWFADS